MMAALPTLQQLAGWAGVDVVLVIVAEVGSLEGAILPVRPVEHGDVRLDATLLDQPGKVLR